MLPVKLTLEGIYSYRERQTIDFTRLTEARLFGIFGPHIVGSVAGDNTMLVVVDNVGNVPAIIEQFDKIITRKEQD